jgi:hypothetical protein
MYIVVCMSVLGYDTLVAGIVRCLPLRRENGNGFWNTHLVPLLDFVLLVMMVIITVL